MCNFSVDYDTFDICDIKDIKKYLMIKHNIVLILGFIKPAFIDLFRFDR